MSRYDHKIETSPEEIEHLSKGKTGHRWSEFIAFIYPHHSFYYKLVHQRLIKKTLEYAELISDV